MFKDGKWVYSRSALLKSHFNAIVGFEDWFYTGPTLAFGHFPPKKSGKKR